jgi:hypothetical protein
LWKSPQKRGETFFIEIIQMSLFTVKQFTEKHPAFTQRCLRALIFNEATNNLKQSGAIVRIGRKILINEEKFFAYLESQNNNQGQTRKNLYKKFIMAFFYAPQIIEALTKLLDYLDSISSWGLR